MIEKPIFKKLTQVAMVVNDVEATAKRYWEDVGIGPWHFYTIDPANTGNMTLRGKPVEHAFRAALATIGDVSWELIEPLDDNSIYAEHLAKHGEGLHHVAFDVENFEKTKTYMKSKGYNEIQSGQTFNVSAYTYLDTDNGLVCITELSSGVEEGKEFPAPEGSYP